jgi:Flp pilus assembly protein TadG
MSRWHDERGSITAFFAVLTVALILCAGLVLDGGRLLAERRSLSDLAAGAARAGAQAISIDDLRASGASTLDPAAATEAARAYLAGEGETGTVLVHGDTVTVTVSHETSMVLLDLAGVGPRQVTATESARTVRGVETGDTT